MKDFSPLAHAASAVLFQCALGLTLGMWGRGGAISCAWFIAREHTQAEYRWIANLGAGKRANMPWWGGFDWRAWSLPSMLDCVVPVLACATVYFVSTM
ncbi:TPA: hypothetical protein OZT99_004097 [Escherichia coli]|nr:hypothetical protein [Escherichia coli]